MIRIATVGTSRITESFIAACRLTDRALPVAAYSRDEDRARAFSKKHNMPLWFSSLEKMAASKEIDAVYIASPNLFHAEQSKIFLKNGKHVICEKPIATSEDEYLSVKSVADEAGLTYMEAIIPVYTKAAEEIRRAVKNAGDIAVARIDYCQLSSRYDSFMAGERHNIFDMSLCAGTLMDLGVYCVYGAVDLLGEPKSISATTTYFYNGADRAGCALFDYGDFTAVLTYSKAGQSAIGTEIVGSRKTVRIGMISQYTDAVEISADGQRRLSDTPDKPELMKGEVIALCDMIDGDKALYDRACQRTQTVHRCMDAIKRSAKIRYGN